MPLIDPPSSCIVSSARGDETQELSVVRPAAWPRRHGCIPSFARYGAEFLRCEHPCDAAIVCDEEAASSSAEHLLGNVRDYRSPIHGRALKGHDVAHAHAGQAFHHCGFQHCGSSGVDEEQADERDQSQ